LHVGATTLGWTYRMGNQAPNAWHIWVSNGGTGSLNWTANDDAAWLNVTPASGTAPTELVISADPAGLVPGVYSGFITITAAGASGSPHTISVTFTVYPPGSGGNRLYLPLVNRK